MKYKTSFYIFLALILAFLLGTLIFSAIWFLFKLALGLAAIGIGWVLYQAYKLFKK